MITLTDIAAAVAYIALWLLTARLLYARWRSGKISGGVHGIRKARYLTCCCYDAACISDGQATIYAMSAAALWWLVLAVALVRFRPPATPMEQAEAKAARDARYAEVTASNAAVEAELFGVTS